MDKCFLILVDRFKTEYITLDETMDHYSYEDFTFHKKKDWYLHLGKDTFLKDGSKVVKLCATSYHIMKEDTFYERLLLVYPEKSGFDTYRFYPYGDMILSCLEKAHGTWKDRYRDGKYLLIEKGRIKTNLTHVFLNNQPYHGEILCDFDWIDALGTRILYHHDFLYMNHFYTEMKYRAKLPQSSLFTYPRKHRQIKECSSFPKVIKEEQVSIPSFEKIKPPARQSLLRQIGPSLTMAMAMTVVAMLNLYLNLQNGRSFLEMLPMILFPVVMLCSTLCWPILLRYLEQREYRNKVKKRKAEYLTEVKEYIEKQYRIEKEKVRNEREHFFHLEAVLRRFKEERLFEIHKEDPFFLKLSLGTCSKEMDYTFEDILEEKEKQELLKGKTKIEDVPLFLSLVDYHQITLQEHEKDHHYFLWKMVLEIASSFSGDDVLIAFYGFEEKVFEGLFTIPHVLHDGKRYHLEKTKELKELEEVARDKEIILFHFKAIKEKMLNPRIHAIYVGEEKIHPHSEAILKVNNGRGSLITKEESREFHYLFETFPFAKFFFNLSQFSYRSETEKEIFSLRDLWSERISRETICESYQKTHRNLIAVFAKGEEDVLEFDLHEKGQGPHGLIAGTTGSGKSELLIALLMSLSLCYPPSYLQMVILDYKGGGILESLSYKGEKIPHILTAISNLESDDIERFLIALKKECLFRQNAFRDLSKRSLSPIMNLDDYRGADPLSFGMENIAHLLIVIDEFAESKKNHPEVMKELISLSRIGRSLGIHLILATQKPSGVIDEEIWANSRFKIALKVQDEKDSQEILRQKEAAYLKRPGCFYLKVDHSLYKGRAAYLRFPMNAGKEGSVSLLNRRLEKEKTAKRKEEGTTSELEYLVKEILEVTKDEKVATFFPPKPEPLMVSALKKKYDIKLQRGDLLLGEIDDIETLYQAPLLHCFNDGHALFVSKRKDEIYLLLSLLENGMYPIVMIAGEKYTHPYLTDSLLYWEENLSFFFHSLLQKKTRQNLLILFEDLNTFLAYEERHKEWFYRLMQLSSILGVTVYALTKMVSTIPYKALLPFERIYGIGIKDRQERMLLFGGSTRDGDAHFFKEKPITYVPCQIERKSFLPSSLPPYIKQIPDVIPFVRKEGEYLLGYDLETREEVYQSETEPLFITGYEETALLQMKEFYRDTNVEVFPYQSVDHRKNYSALLWVGSGLLTQRLFYTNEKKELEEGEAYYIHKQKRIRLRVVNDVT